MSSVFSRRTIDTSCEILQIVRLIVYALETRSPWNISRTQVGQLSKDDVPSLRDFFIRIQDTSSLKERKKKKKRKRNNDEEVTIIREEEDARERKTRTLRKETRPPYLGNRNASSKLSSRVCVDPSLRGPNLHESVTFSGSTPTLRRHFSLPRYENIISYSQLTPCRCLRLLEIGSAEMYFANCI
ncbi:hypothetical protein PUN28_000363 [Cardiocondyla obscurior]|uniref:Uncharacterized protein n=1 Tax=Cardiocondyla obscurior TaxID=286306 RepID=A0AAW2GZ19_9HYME